MVSDEQNIPNKTLYLGLLTDSNEFFPKVAIKALEGISKHYPNDDSVNLLLSSLKNEENDDMNYFQSNYMQPKHYHITTYFKKKHFDTKHKAYKAFKRNEDVNIKIVGVIFVPYKIMTSVVFMDSPCDNEFPHITTLLGSFKPKDSNELCKLLFSKNCPLEKEYLNSFLKEYEVTVENDIVETLFLKEFCYKGELTIMNQKEEVYFIRFEEDIVLNSKMTCFTN